MAATTFQAPALPGSQTISPSPSYPAFPRLPPGSSVPISRNASTSSSRSTTTTSSTSSLVAAPIRPPPIETRTAATNEAQLPSRPGSSAQGALDGGYTSSGSAGYPSMSGSGYHSPVPGGGGAGAYGGPAGMHAGRGLLRNGPRSRQGTMALPAIVTTVDVPSRASSVPLPVGQPDERRHLSPTTPTARSRFADSDDDATMQQQHRLSHSGGSSGGTRRASRASTQGLSDPSSPLAPSSSNRNSGGSAMTERKSRTLSVGADARAGSSERDRRQSMASNKSGATSRARESPRDYVFGEELGRGSYSTVVQAVRASSSSNASPTSSAAPRQYAIKIINQAHLVHHNKVKYAMIERDALVRLGTPRPSGPYQGKSPSSRRNSGAAAGAHTPHTPRSRRGTPASAAGGGTGASASAPSTSTIPAVPVMPNMATLAAAAGPRDPVPISWDRTSVFSDSSATSTVFGSSAPMSPMLSSSLAGRRPSRSADPPEALIERSEDGHEPPPSSSALLVKSRPPSPVCEEPSELRLEQGQEPPASGGQSLGPGDAMSTVVAEQQIERPAEKRAANRNASAPPGKEQTPRSRRASQALSEKSKSGKSSIGPPHAGVIRLYSTFNDAQNLYFVLDLAPNGELLAVIRKYGSLDLASARYYAAQLIDTIEFMHERGVIHRDLKPENDMRIKITDFGSATIIKKDESKQDKPEKESDGTKEPKRSFVGTADFVSPEVLRNEPAVFASDIWAFGGILYQLLVGKPPFRTATDYLTFQKILHAEFEYPEGFDTDAKALIDSILVLDPAQRPTPAEIKTHAFFASTDFSTIWQIPAPQVETGLSRPVQTLASLPSDNDIWAVFDDEVSDGGFQYDDDGDGDDVPTGESSRPPHEASPGHGVRPLHDERLYSASPTYDHRAAARAVAAVDDLVPPRPAWMDNSPSPSPAGNKIRKARGWSRGSARTNSSSSSRGAALAGLLEHISFGSGSNRTSRASGRSDDRPVSRGRDDGKTMGGSGAARDSDDRMVMTLPGVNEEVNGNDKWSSLLLANEHILFTSPMSIRTSALPAFISPAPKRRQLILTDFPRLIAVKEEPVGRRGSLSTPSNPTAGQQADSVRAGSPAIINGQPAGDAAPMTVKSEYVFVVRPTTETAGSSTSQQQHQQHVVAREFMASAAGLGGVNRVDNVQEKGSKGFVVQTSHIYLADTTALRDQWLEAIRQVAA